MKTRPGCAADLEQVAALERDLFGADAWSPALLAPRMGDESCLVAEEDGSVVGYVVTMGAGDVVDLQRLGVPPGHRRRGIARALLIEALDAAPRVLVEVGANNPGALAFYAAEGFAEISRRSRYYRDGSDGVVLERKGAP